MILAKCKDTSGSCAVVKGALFLHLPTVSVSVVFLMKNFSSICFSSVCYAMEFIIYSANLVFFVEPKVNRLWKKKVWCTQFLWRGFHPQSAQNGNSHFLAYIPSWSKTWPRLVRVGGDARPPLHISTITYKFNVVQNILLHLFLLCPYTLWFHLRRHLPLLCVQCTSPWVQVYSNVCIF